VGSRSRPVEARVSRISPFLQPGSFSAEAEIDVPNEAGALMPGMFVTVDIFYGETGRTTLVPASAVYEDPATGQTGVFVTREALPAASAPPSNASESTKPRGILLSFRPVEVVVEAPQTVGVEGVAAGEWVVVIGQHLLASQSDAAGPRATVRVMEWDRILELQQLQRQDLLTQFMERQQRARGED
jgi:HlyD family secretion protein